MTAMPALGMTVGCPHCGGMVECVNGRTNGSLSVAIVACCDCHREYEVTARIHFHRNPPKKGGRRV